MNKDSIRGYVLGLVSVAAVTAICGGVMAAFDRDDSSEAVVSAMREARATMSAAAASSASDRPACLSNGAYCGRVSHHGGYYAHHIELPETHHETYYGTRNDASRDYIFEDEAYQYALKDAGVDAQSATLYRCDFDWDNGRAVYDVEFYSGNMEYDYEIDALTGAVLERDNECEDFDWHHDESYHSGHHGTSYDTSSNLITEDEAVQAALDNAGVKKSDAVRLRTELDYDDGVQVYKVEFHAGAYEYEYEIDAQSGKIIDKEIDRD